jgi:hypothetical protein
MLAGAVGAAEAVEIGAIRFPDTAPGSSSTLACEEMIGLCFVPPGQPNARCAASGTVQSASGPNLPFAVGTFNLLTLAQFDAGLCEANPVTFPVVVGPGQVLAFQGTFSPADAGEYAGTLTLTIPGSPPVDATYALSGRAAERGLGLITVKARPDPLIIPGNLAEISYQISPGSLTENVDVYFGVLVPGSSQFLFLNEAGGFGPAIAPFRRNVAPSEQSGVVFSAYPVDLPFGQYELLMGLVHAGQPGSLDTLAAPLAQASVTFGALSEDQKATLRQRGNPDHYSMFWLAEANEKREVWMYLGAEPLQYVYRNGSLETLTALDDPPGPRAKIDPGLFTPQTSRALLDGALGPPASATAFEGFDLLSYPGGLDVIFRDGRLSSVNTVAP